MMMSRRGRAQSGMALIVALIMLVLMTVVCLASFNIGRTGLDVVSNMQRRNEAVSSANAAIEQAISTSLMYLSPSSVFPTPCTVPNTVCYDLNADGVNDVSVALTPAPTCLQAQIIPTSALHPDTSIDDQSCIQGAGKSLGQGVSSGNSMCGNTVWEVTATAQDSITGASATVVEGIAVRVPANTIASGC